MPVRWFDKVLDRALERIALDRVADEPLVVLGDDGRDRQTVVDVIALDAFAQNEIARLEEARISAVEDRIEADLAVGRHSDGHAARPFARALQWACMFRRRPREGADDSRRWRRRPTICRRRSHLPTSSFPAPADMQPVVAS